MVKIFSIFLFLGLGLVLSECGKKDKKESTQSGPGGKLAQQPPLVVEGYIVKEVVISNDIEIPGTILPFESTEIHPEVSGRVVMLNVKEGGFVGQGAVLARLYDGDLQAQLKKLQVQLGIAEATERRSAELLKIQGISQQDYDLSLLSVNNIKADIEITSAGISKTIIRAPFSGKLGLKNISQGAFITPTTVITTIAQVSQLKMQFSVPEKYGAQIRSGQSIDFTIDGSNDTYHAQVSATEVAVEEDTRTLAVRAIVKGKNTALVPGSFAKVKIELGKNDHAIMIPSGSVVPLGRKKQIYMFNGGKAKTTDITTGVRDSSNVEVLSGLKTGDTIITTGLLFLKPGSDVKLSKIN